MAVSNALARYLELERLMLALDAEDNPAADILRDAMDPLWYSLSEDEIRLLDERPTPVKRSFAEIRLPIIPELFLEPPVAQQPGEPWPSEIKKWEWAA